MDDEPLDIEITRFLRAYGGAAAIPVDHIARAVGLADRDALTRLEQRLTSLARDGRVRRSRVFPNRWLAATGAPVRAWSSSGASPSRAAHAMLGSARR